MYHVIYDASFVIIIYHHEPYLYILRTLGAELWVYARHPRYLSFYQPWWRANFCSARHDVFGTARGRIRCREIPGSTFFVHLINLTNWFIHQKQPYELGAGYPPSPPPPPPPPPSNSPPVDPKLSASFAVRFRSGRLGLFYAGWSMVPLFGDDIIINSSIKRMVPWQNRQKMAAKAASAWPPAALKKKKNAENLFVFAQGPVAFCKGLSCNVHAPRK